MVAKIYKPAKTAMQSGKALDKWVLEFEPASRRAIDPLMGWTSTDETRSQVRLSFDTKEEAISYAKHEGIPFRVVEPHVPRPVKKSYANNFRYGRRVSWTH